MKYTKALIGVMDPNSYAFRVTFEKLLEYIDPKIKYKKKTYHVTSRRVATRPYDVLKAKCPYKAIMNRGAHWNPHHNSFFMTIGYQTYLLNDMITFEAINKNTSYGHMYKLGLNIPNTIALPQQSYDKLKKDKKAVSELIFSEHEFFSLEEMGKEVGYPAFLKPQSGGGWVGVVRVEDEKELKEAYSKSGSKPMNLQKAVDYTEFVRTVGVGPQMMPMHYNASAEFSHDRYMRNEFEAIAFDFLTAEQEDEVKKIGKIINSFYGWDHNSCESLIGHDNVIYPIDFANAYPDSTLTSLHFHFPALVKNMVKWLVFCAVTQKKRSYNFAQRWPEYFAIAEDKSLSYKQKLDAYAKIADRYFETEKFEEFCTRQLSDFDERAYEFFASDDFYAIIDKEVEYYFTIASEIPAKKQHYRGIHQFWLETEKQNLEK